MTRHIKFDQLCDFISWTCNSKEKKKLLFPTILTIKIFQRLTETFEKLGCIVCDIADITVGSVPSKVGSRPHSEVKVEFGGISAKNNYDAGV